MSFDPAAFLSLAMFAKISRDRVDRPELPQFSAERRKRRTRLAPEGRLSILAADHPARGVVSVGDDEHKMTDRYDYLSRVLAILATNAADGVMATMDILEELLIYDQLLFEEGQKTVLDGKLLIASLNRGGIQGTAWELNDPLTGATVESCLRYKLDGAKLLMRVDWNDRDSLETINACVDALNRCHEAKLPVFLEPLPVHRDEAGAVVVDKIPEALSRLVGVASALGSSSTRIWLKLPYCKDYERVARATTLPILLLGGKAASNIGIFLEQMEEGLKAGSNIRGTMLGRNILYPATGDPVAAAMVVHQMVHDRWTAAKGLKVLEASQKIEIPTKTVTRG